jgi:hypothetical protein
MEYRRDPEIELRYKFESNKGYKYIGNILSKIKNDCYF